MSHFPEYRGRMEYVCLSCHSRFPATELLYTCPRCSHVLLLENADAYKLKEKSGAEWREIFDRRAMSRLPALRGIFRFYELLAPVFSEDDIVYLGEANTPIIEASPRLTDRVGIPFAFKNDGQNPSASFKDRGMACAFSYLRWLARARSLKEIIAICASTGDTSAAAALYAAYVGPPVKSVVILPEGKVTPQQLAQPLGSGAIVLEVPGVFDDCMKIVEILAEHYNVALLNSKNSWRILGQESYACEAAQWYDWNLSGQAMLVPIGNAGNITAIMGGLIKLHDLGLITALPQIIGVQSSHADPVYRYYSAKEEDRVWQPVTVRPSVAQAAMIGNPVSFPRVKMLAQKYMDIAGADAFRVIQVEEQEIMEAMLLANRHGHIACTQGGECLAGLIKAKKQNICKADHAILDSTAHALKFINFQTAYFESALPADYEIKTRQELCNYPLKPLAGLDRGKMGQDDFARQGAELIAKKLQL